jgi:hypothetical protein
VRQRRIEEAVYVDQPAVWRPAQERRSIGRGSRVAESMIRWRDVVISITHIAGRPRIHVIESMRCAKMKGSGREGSAAHPGTRAVSLRGRCSSNTRAPATDLGTTKSSRENPVNQSGSVALSTEAMRGPPWRNSLIIMALLTRDYEPGGRGFKSCRARQISMTWQRKPSPPICCGTVVGPLIHRSSPC